MFYAHFVLSKKGPLARIWLAAHWDKKLTKAHVFETNIESSVEGILQPKVKMALRTSGHLLLGVVRIYSRKAKYLLADCNEAFIKIKMAFRPGVVDLPEESREAALNAITLPEVFHDFDSAMPELNDMEISYRLNQSRSEEITLIEDYGNIKIIGDDGFGDDGATFEDQRDGSVNYLFNSKDDRDGTSHSDKDKHSSMDIDAPIPDDFGSGVGGAIDSDTGTLFGTGLFDEAMDVEQIENISNEKNAKPAAVNDKKPNESDDDDDDDFYGDNGPASVGCHSSGPSSPGSPLVSNKMNIDDDINEDQPPAANVTPPLPDQTTLVANEDEAFALAPLETNIFQGIERGKGKRKRKLIIDEVKNISGEEMKSQLADTTDIVTTLDLAPPTKRLMHWKETGGVEKLFALPGRQIHSKCLSKLYQRHLTTRAAENENIGLISTYPTEAEEYRDNLETNKDDNILQISQVASPGHRSHSSIAIEEQFNNLSNEDLADSSRTLPKSSLPDELPLLDTTEPVQQVPQTPQQLSPIPPLQIPQQQSPPLQFQQPTSSRIHQDTETLADNQERNQQSHVSIAIEPSLQDLPEFDLQPSVSHSELLQSHDDFFSQAAAPSSLSQNIEEIRPQTTQFQHDDEEDDFGCPVSVGPPEEQGADETYEQFEERILNKRAQQMLYIVQRHFARQRYVRFSELAKNNTRKQVAQKFYTLLVLKKQQAVELEQQEAFGELLVSQGPKLNLMY